MKQKNQYKHEKTSNEKPPEDFDIFDADELWNKALEDGEEFLKALDDGENDEAPTVTEKAAQGNFKTKYDETLDRYQRTLAEFDNYRKRTTKEMAARYDDGVRAACLKLLPIIDNFDRAMDVCENKEDKFYEGIALIARQFAGAIAEMGVEEIYIEPGAPFDTNLHYAVAHIEDEKLGQNVVAETLQKGYTHKEKVLRHTMVKVAN